MINSDRAASKTPAPTGSGADPEERLPFRWVIVGYCATLASCVGLALFLWVGVDVAFERAALLSVGSAALLASARTPRALFLVLRSVSIFELLPTKAARVVFGLLGAGMVLGGLLTGV